MKKYGNNRRIDHSRRAWISVATIVIGTVLGLLVGFEGKARASEPKPMLMFVQIAEDLKVDAAARTFRLVKVSPQTLYFSDRPERIAGHIKMSAYLSEWTSKAGKDNFGNDPPNATLSVYEPGQPNNSVAVVEISNPKVSGSDLVYNYKLIEGTLPASGGATALFIDWIGVGGGVGPGFHGVGVGARGPGLR
jgi:hypothetical protein